MRVDLVDQLVTVRVAQEKIAYFIIDPPLPETVHVTTSIIVPAAMKKHSMTTDDEPKDERAQPLLRGLRSPTKQTKSIDNARYGRHIMTEISIERTEATDAAMADHVSLVSLIEEASLTIAF